METVQQHEWVDTGSYKYFDTYYKACVHCGIEKKTTNSNRAGQVEYRDKYNHLLLEEPACITRTPGKYNKNKL
jgi:hypothetical protein